MITVACHHDHELLPKASENLIPVQIYGNKGKQRGDIAIIGNPLIKEIKRLGLPLNYVVMDFLTIALVVTAADTFVKRKHAVDGWVREICLQFPLCEPEKWIAIKSQLERVLHFLSGDVWHLEISAHGMLPPKPYKNNGREP
jgi:hypothetical protein